MTRSEALARVGLSPIELLNIFAAFRAALRRETAELKESFR
jgi:hypothetical protein